MGALVKKTLIILCLMVYVGNQAVYAVSNEMSNDYGVAENRLLSNEDCSARENHTSRDNETEDVLEKGWGKVFVTILGSGVTSTLVGFFIEKNKYRRLTILSKADALYGAFIMRFEGNFLSRDDHEFSLFKERFEQFKEEQGYLISFLENDNHCNEFIRYFDVEVLLEIIKKGIADGKSEQIIRDEIGRAHGRLASKLVGKSKKI